MESKHKFKVIKTETVEESIKFIEQLTITFQNNHQQIKHLSFDNFNAECLRACNVTNKDALFDKLINVKGVTNRMANEISTYFGDFETMRKRICSDECSQSEDMFLHDLTKTQTSKFEMVVPKRTSIRIHQTLFEQD